MSIKSQAIITNFKKSIDFFSSKRYTINMEGTYMKSEQKEIKVDNFKSPLERRIDAAIKESDRILASNPKWVSEKEFWDRMEKV